MNIFDNFYQALQAYPSLQSVFTVYDVLLNFILSVLLIIPIAYTYRKTHKGVTYNQMFTHTMFVMAVSVSIIMMIIGSNIARAFSLVGALSIIRFRTAVKDSRDTGYIFASMAVGMACGTGMYLVAITFSLLYCGLMHGLTYFRVGEKILVDKLLKVSAKSEASDESFSKIIGKHVQTSAMIHSEASSSENVNTFTYVISSDQNQTDSELLKELQAANGVQGVSLYYNDQRIEI